MQREGRGEPTTVSGRDIGATFGAAEDTFRGGLYGNPTVARRS